ncbi:hypothetical protein ACFX1T_044981 [Malus domestica]
MLPTDAPQKPQQITQRPDFIGHFAYFNLTICYLTTVYRAYRAGDYPVLAFVVFSTWPTGVWTSVSRCTAGCHIAISR